MWKPWTWIRSSNERAVANARAASIECSRRRVESVEVQLYLDRLAVARSTAPHAAQHPA